MDNDTPPLTLIQKLCAIQQALKVPKSHYNEFGHYPFRTAEDIYNAVKPLTQQFDCALTLTDEPVLYGNRIYIKATSRLLDDSGSLSTDGYAREADAQKGMNEAQLTGASSSFARKYALCGLLLLDDSKDIDTFDHRGTAPQSTTRAPGAAPTNAINQIIQMIKNQDVDGIKCHWHTLINDHWAQLDESARLELNALVRSQ